MGQDGTLFKGLAANSPGTRNRFDRPEMVNTGTVSLNLAIGTNDELDHDM
jgi:hypothetical protein